MVSTRRSRRKDPENVTRESPNSTGVDSESKPNTGVQEENQNHQRTVYTRIRLREERINIGGTDNETFVSEHESVEKATLEYDTRSGKVSSFLSDTDPLNSWFKSSNDNGNVTLNVPDATANLDDVQSMQTEVPVELEKLTLSDKSSFDTCKAGANLDNARDDVLSAINTDIGCDLSSSNTEMFTGPLRGCRAEENGIQNLNNLEQERDNFGWLVQTGRVITIDPLDTIPLTRIRDVTDSGVAKLEFLFTRSANGPGMSMGPSSAAPQPVVVMIPDDRLHYVVDYFISVKRLCPENADAISRSKVWFGIVEGAHRRKALINLAEKDPSRFKGYPWVVMCVDWQPIDILRAFARERNEFQRGEHLVDFTLYDIFKNLKQSADKVALREGLTEGRSTNRGYLKRVADHYCGRRDSANNLTRQLAGIAAALSWRVIEEMGALLNKEDMERARSIAESAGYPGIEYIDGRVSRNLFTRSTFRGATTFKSLASEEDQINTIRRISFLAPQTSYKSVTKTQIEAQNKKAMAARREVTKMETKLGNHDWPVDMISVRNMLLTTTILDSEVEEQERNEDLLPTFDELWRKLFPISSELESANARLQDDDSSLRTSFDQNIKASLNTVDNSEAVLNDQEADNSDTLVEERGTLETVNDTEIDESDMPASNDLSGAERYQREGTDACNNDEEDQIELCPLKQLSVRVENKGWRDFQRTLSNEDLFDFIFADPVQSLCAQDLKQNIWTEFKDERKVREFANFCRVCLRPGCYVFVIVLAEEFGTFSAAFQADGMQVMKVPFLFTPSPDSVRVTRLKNMPQPCGELAVVAKTPGSCSNFSARFSQPYSLFNCTFKRKIGVMDNVPRCQNPLRGSKSRAEVRPRERHPDFVSEVIETFCSPTGTVLDIFGGALTTGLSCVSSRHPCVILEQDRYCFDLGMRRLEKLCRDKLLNPDEAPRASGEISSEEEERSE